MNIDAYAMSPAGRRSAMMPMTANRTTNATKKNSTHTQPSNEPHARTPGPHVCMRLCEVCSVRMVGGGSKSNIDANVRAEWRARIVELASFSCWCCCVCVCVYFLHFIGLRMWCERVRVPAAGYTHTTRCQIGSERASICCCRADVLLWMDRGVVVARHAQDGCSVVVLSFDWWKTN